MAYALATFWLSPARVHDRARDLIGHHPCWIRRPYGGGLFSREHYRICSYCACIHPADLMDLLAAGGSWLEQSSKPGKRLLLTPNPVAGLLVEMGSMPGPVFPRARPPGDIRDRLSAAPSPDLGFEPSRGERLACHFERPSLEPAPALIAQPFYSEHTNEPQWAEIEAAAEGANP